MQSTIYAKSTLKNPFKLKQPLLTIDIFLFVRKIENVRSDFNTSNTSIEKANYILSNKQTNRHTKFADEATAKQLPPVVQILPT